MIIYRILAFHMTMHNLLRLTNLWRLWVIVSPNSNPKKRFLDRSFFIISGIIMKDFANNVYINPLSLLVRMNNFTTLF